MDELEGIERERWRVFALSGVGVGLMYFVATSRLVDAVLMGLCIGLLGSGVAVARRITAPHVWAAVEAEARQNGGSPRPWKVWLGNLLPFAIATALSVAWIASQRG